MMSTMYSAAGSSVHLVQRIDHQPHDAGEQQQERIRAPIPVARRHLPRRTAYAAEAALRSRCSRGWQLNAVGPAGED